MKAINKITTLIADRINEKNRYYILAAVLFGVFLMDYFLVMMPQVRTFIALNPKIQALSKDIKQAQDDIAHKPQYEAQAALLREKMQAVGSSILRKDEIPRILDNIALIAGKNKIKITQIMPLKEAQEVVLVTDNTKYYALPISVNARGSYHDLGRFINRVEQDAIFMTVSELDIAATGEDPIRHAATMKIRAFISEVQSK